MRWRIYGLWAVLAVSLVGLGLIVWETSPDGAPAALKTLFFITITMAVWSLATLIIFRIKSRFARSRLFDETAYESVFYDSLLQGLLVTGAIITAVLIRRLF